MGNQEGELRLPFLLYYGAKGAAMTKTEFLAQPVDELRAALLEMFDDPNGDLAEASKKDLVVFARDNWDVIEGQLPEEAEDAEEAEEPETEEIEASEEEEILDEGDLSKPNPKTDLYTYRLPEPNPKATQDLA